jgi:hypothetical protein
LASSWIIAWYPDWTFRPNWEITRSEYLKMLFLVKKVELITYQKEYFLDVKSNYWQKRYVDTWIKLWLLSATNKNFNPNSSISRVEALKMAIILFKWDVNLIFKQNLNDVKATDWFSKYVEYSIQHNLFQISWNNFSPNKALTRLEAIWIIYTLSKN